MSSKTSSVSRVWWATAAGLFAFALLLFAGTGTAEGEMAERTYTASIFPNIGATTAAQMCDGPTQALRFTYMNDATSTHPTGSVGYSVPAPLVVRSVGMPIADNGKMWTATRTVTTTSTEIVLVAASPADKLAPGESVSLVIALEYPEGAPTPASLTIGVSASQSDDPGGGNQFLGDDVTVSVIECAAVTTAPCGTRATVNGNGFSSSSSADCAAGDFVITGVVSGPGTCGGAATKGQILVGVTDPLAPTTVVTDVQKSLIGGNMAAIKVCKNGDPWPFQIESIGGSFRITVTFDPGDPIKGFT